MKIKLTELEKKAVKIGIENSWGTVEKAEREWLSVINNLGNTGNKFTALDIKVTLFQLNAYRKLFSWLEGKCEKLSLEELRKAIESHNLEGEEPVEVFSSVGDYIRVVHDNAFKKGFWQEDRKVSELLALIHSEVSEALEADRKNDKEGFREELADIVIRVFDLCGGLKIDLESEIKKKIEKNKKREHKHGKKY